jgi:hypothetical protein
MGKIQHAFRHFLTVAGLYLIVSAAKAKGKEKYSSFAALRRVGNAERKDDEDTGSKRHKGLLSRGYGGAKLDNRRLEKGVPSQRL